MSPRFSPESKQCDRLHLAGLLAWIDVEYLPAEQFSTVVEVSTGERLIHHWLSDKTSGNNSPPYSYGDSAGFPPDFPFHPVPICISMREPNAG